MKRRKSREVKARCFICSGDGEMPVELSPMLVAPKGSSWVCLCPKCEPLATLVVTLARKIIKNAVALKCGDEIEIADMETMRNELKQAFKLSKAAIRRVKRYIEAAEPKYGPCSIFDKPKGKAWSKK